MVSISKSRVKSRRKAKSRNEIQLELFMTYGCIAICILMVVIGLMRWILSNGSNGGSDGGSDGSSSSLMTKKKHTIRQGEGIEDKVHLNFESNLDDSYKAIALDIMEFLDCSTIMKDTVKNLKEENEYENGHRRLQEEEGGGGQVNNDDDNDDDRIVRRQHPHPNDGNLLMMDDVSGGFGDGGGGRDAMMDDGMFGGGGGEEEEEERMMGGGGGGAFDDGVLGPMEDDLLDNHGSSSSYETVTGVHLFCLAALNALEDVTEFDKTVEEYWKEEITCDATETKQQSLLDLWSAARAEISEQEVLKTTLQVAKENSHHLWDKVLHLWSPIEDDGTLYILRTLNDELDVLSQQQQQQQQQQQDELLLQQQQGFDMDNDNTNNQDQEDQQHKDTLLIHTGTVRGLSNNLGPGHTFVDVGSCLGITTLAVALLYPGTRIVSIEPAAPNWFMQEINLRCNLVTTQQYPTVLLAGIGPQHANYRLGGGKETPSMLAKFMWRPQATTATRSWTPQSEKLSSDIELMVKLKSWKSLLDEAGIGIGDTNSQQPHIDVLNVDCEGCEYNLIPSLSEAEFQAIDMIMGGVHWGYIPQHKLPSSHRAKRTHERLCQHEHFARTSKECCAFPDQKVFKSSQPGEILVQDIHQFPPVELTIRDVAGSLCDDFDTWSENNHLFTIENDFGWFQLSSMAN